MYPYSTVLRVYPEEDSNDHYTAFVFDLKGSIDWRSKTKIKEVGGPPGVVRDTMYHSIYDWLTSINPSLSENCMYINMRRPILTTETCQVPLRSDKRNPMKWGRHIYTTIKKFAPHLLRKELVVNAYNILIIYLNSVASIITMNLPHFTEKYIRAISMEGYRLLPLSCSFRMYHGNPDILCTISSAYLTLYELIKTDLLPHINIKQQEYYMNVMVPRYKHSMAKIIAQKIQKDAVFEKRLENRQIRMDNYITLLTEKYASRILYGHTYLYEMRLIEIQEKIAEPKQQKYIQACTHSYQTCIARKHYANTQRINRLQAKEEQKVECLRAAHQRKMDHLTRHIMYYSDKIEGSMIHE